LKKITSILIIALLFFDSCGYIFVYLELSRYFKQESSLKINEIFSKDDIEIIALHKSDLTKNNSPVKFIEEKEILYKGELFDIYNTISFEDSIYYYCLNDRNENILEKAFTIYLDKNTQENSKNIPIYNILHNIIKIAITPTQFDFNQSQHCIKYENKFIYLISQYSFDIPTPPPKKHS
jgi:hypothetical protein